MMYDRLIGTKLLHELKRRMYNDGYSYETLDLYVLLFIINAGEVKSLEDKEGWIRGIKKYDEGDYLNRYDTGAEILIDLDLIDPSDLD